MATLTAGKNKFTAKPSLAEPKKDALMKARLFLNAEATLQQATFFWLAVEPELQLSAAVELFQSNEVSLERASEIAGLNRWVFQKHLAGRGVAIVIDTDSVDELDQAVDKIQDRMS